MDPRKCLAAVIALLFLAFLAQPALAQTYTSVAAKNRVPTPKVVGMPVDKATEAAKKAGFGLTVSYQETQNKAIDGTVATQADAVPKGAKSYPVSVWKYKEPVKIPNVAGMQLDKARETARAAGYDLTITYKDTPRWDSHNMVAQQYAPAAKSIPVIVWKTVPPNVTGMPLNQAKELAQRAGFDLAVTYKETSDRAVDSKVIQQQYNPGAKSIQVTVWGYNDKILFAVIPDVKGMPLEQAKKAIEAAGFKWTLAAVNKVAPPGMAGKVERQDPVGRMLRTTTVSLWAWDAQATIVAPVPNVVGMTQAQAQDALQKAGFAPRVAPARTYNSNQGLVGKVASQMPASGYNASHKSPVDIFLYALPEHVPTVPNVVGMTVDQAKSAMEKEGIQAVVVPNDKTTTDKTLVGKVFYQERTPGETLPKGFKVNIMAWKLAPVPPPPTACDVMWKEHNSIPMDKPAAALAAAEKIQASCDASMKCCAWLDIGHAKERMSDFGGAADAFEKIFTCKSTLCSYDPAAYRKRIADLRQKASAATNAAKGDALFKSGNEKAKARNYPGAIGDYNQLISQFPNTAPVCTARYNRGLCKEGLGDLNGALADYGDALKCTGGNADIQKASERVKAAIAGQGCSAALKSASDRLAKGDNRGAADEFGKAAGMCPAPKKCFAVSDRGIAKERMGDRIGALADYEEGVKCDPQNAGLKTTLANGRYNVANVHNTAGRYDDAIRLFLSALELKPDFTQARHNLALAYWGRGMTREQQGVLENAAADFASALKADPTNKRAQDGQARVKAKMEESKKRASTGSAAR